MTETQDIPPERSDSNRQYEENADVDMDNEPSHHARRPMNAFLIFCKRHRTVVRDKYPNLENRSITKILGEWWANLDSEDKASYTGLAKEYKDAFFNANPDFKWYKLPAPPRRTFATRPGNNSNIYTEQENYPTIDTSETRVKSTNNNHLLKINYNVASTSKHFAEEKRSVFTPGKLADETQMGGLNSLIVPKPIDEMDNVEYLNSHTYHDDNYSTPNNKSNCNANPNPPKKHPLSERRGFNDVSPSGEEKDDIKIQRLQDELSKTTRFLTLSFNDSNESASLENGVCHDPNKIDYCYSEHSSNESYKSCTQSEPDNSNNSLSKLSHCDAEEYGEKTSHKNVWLHSLEKSHRSCKGKRYQEFMADGSLTGNKRLKKDNVVSPTSSWKPFEEIPNKSETDTADVSKSAYNINDTGQRISSYEENSSDQSREFSEMGNKLYKASDFDLDAKIKALPSLSLEKFQQKKKENKKRKKNVTANKIKDIKPKPSSNADPLSDGSLKNFSKPHSETKPCDRVDAATLPIIDRTHLAEQHKSAIIGSRKRKPRKISITRLDINSTMKMQKPDGCINTSLIYTAMPMDDICGLATLAEVAAKMQT